MFKSLDSSSRRHSRLPSEDLESGQALLGDISPEMSDRRSSRTCDEFNE